MRPPKRLEAPACRTGSSPLNDAIGYAGVTGLEHRVVGCLFGAVDQVASALRLSGHPGRGRRRHQASRPVRRVRRKFRSPFIAGRGGTVSAALRGPQRNSLELVRETLVQSCRGRREVPCAPV